MSFLEDQNHRNHARFINLIATSLLISGYILRTLVLYSTKTVFKPLHSWCILSVFLQDSFQAAMLSLLLVACVLGLSSCQRSSLTPLMSGDFISRDIYPNAKAVHKAYSAVWYDPSEDSGDINPLTFDHVLMSYSSCRPHYQFQPLGWRHWSEAQLRGTSSGSESGPGDPIHPVD